MRVDKRAVTGGTPYSATANTGLTCFRIINDSPFDLDITWGPGGTVSETVAPHTVEDGMVPEQVQVTMGNSRWGGTISISPVVPIGGTLPDNAPAQQVTIDGYSGLRPRRGYGLSRLQNVGNSSGGSSAMANQLKNDGNNPGTNVIEVTQSGSTGSNISADNQANFVLAEYVGGILTTIFQVIAGATAGNDVVKLGKAGNFFAHVLGNLKVDGSLSSDAALLTTDGAGGITAASLSTSGNVTGAFLIGTRLVCSGGPGGNDAFAFWDTGAPDSMHFVTPSTGVANFFQFTTWNGSAAVNLFSMGAQVGLSTSWLDGSGHYFDAGHQVMPGRSAGGGASGTAIWEGTTDPAGSAAEGDLWLDA